MVNLPRVGVEHMLEGGEEGETGRQVGQADPLSHKIRSVHKICVKDAQVV